MCRCRRGGGGGNGRFEGRGQKEQLREAGTASEPAGALILARRYLESVDAFTPH